MATKPFSLSTTLRMIPNHLLREFLVKQHHAEFAVKWDEPKEKNVGHLLTYIDQLAHCQRDPIERVLHSVSDMASEAGLAVLFQTADRCGSPELVDEAPEGLGVWGRTMWIWLRNSEIFDKAQLLFQLDQMSFWRKRTDLPDVTPDVSPMAIKDLSQEISALLRKQGRGKVCTVDWRNHDEDFYFFAYPDDFIANVLMHDEDGNLTSQAIRQTLYLVFAYRPSEYSLELFAKGLDSKIKERLEMIFVKTILHWDLDNYDPEAAYELDHLKYEFVNLKTDPADRIRVRIRKLRLSSRIDGRSVEIKIDEDETNPTIAKVIQDMLQLEKMPLDQWRVTLVTFQFKFCQLDGRKPSKQSFDIAYPRSCSLRNARPERVELIQKYLKRWGIDLAEPPKYALA